MVQAAYSTGHPAIGVGSGNAPVLVADDADLLQACGSIVLGKTFDNGMICASEQSVVIDDRVYDVFKKMLQKRGVYFLQGDDKKKLQDILIRNGRVNVDVVGQSAQHIADMMNIQVPVGTVVLAAEETGVGANKVTLLGKTEEPIRYDLPDELIGKLWKGKYRGQEQLWYCARFNGEDADIDLEAHDPPEFSQWKWLDPEQLPDVIVPFKKHVYQAVLNAFRGLI